MKFSTAACTALVALFNLQNVQGFSSSGRISTTTRTTTLASSWGSNSQVPTFASKQLRNKLIISLAKDEDEEEETTENPYADPNYPELEFVNYDDPDYVVDQGQVEDEFFTKPTDEDDDTLEQIEAMREERRRRNDEFQFETYHSKMLKNGQSEYFGEWTTYRTSTFLDSVKEEDKLDVNGMPRLLKAKSVLRMVSSGKKVPVDMGSDWRVDNERIEHLERVATEEETEGLLLSSDNEGDADDLVKLQQLQAEKERQTKQMLGSSYVPTQLSSFDFRGQQGNMIVGNAYTVCDTIPLPLDSKLDGKEDHDGPFQEMRTEIGIQDDGKRFRVKFDYRVEGAGPDDDEEKKQTFSLGEELPPLLLSSLTVCREALDRWPISSSPITTDDDEEGDESSEKNFDVSLFGSPGAAGGLYDPPPVGTDSQAAQYMMIDLEGGASILFPFKLDQDPSAHEGRAKSWVTSLDWSVGKFRYQVDRKVLTDKKLKGLKTLELSEVQSSDAATYRPTDGGEDMRQ